MRSIPFYLLFLFTYINDKKILKYMIEIEANKIKKKKRFLAVQFKS